MHVTGLKGAARGSNCGSGADHDPFLPVLGRYVYGRWRSPLPFPPLPLLAAHVQYSPLPSQEYLVSSSLMIIINFSYYCSKCLVTWRGFLIREGLANLALLLG